MPLKCIYFKTVLLLISGWKVQTELKMLLELGIEVIILNARRVKVTYE